MADDSIGLGAFVEAAGAGLSEAQGKIAGADLRSTAMAVSEATLVAKVLLDVDTSGAVRVSPLGRAEIQSLGANVSSLSTVTVNFVATTDSDGPANVGPPPIVRHKAIEAVATRADVVRLGQVLGPLSFDATFVPERSTWLVTATDPAGRTVREALVDREG